MGGEGAGKKEFEGYKGQVAETVSEGSVEKGEPTKNFLTAVSIRRATESDEAGRQQVLEEQTEMGLERPEAENVDGAYVSAKEIVKAQEEGRQLMGPAQPACWPRNKGFSAEAFEVVVEERKALCPEGKQSTQCSRLEEEKTDKVSYRFEWSWECRDCPLRNQCVREGQKHRSLVVGEHHSVLQKRRQEMKTPEFKEAMRNRNACSRSALRHLTSLSLPLIDRHCSHSHTRSDRARRDSVGAVNSRPYNCMSPYITSSTHSVNLTVDNH